jgi:hypothetical protein
MLTVDTTDDVKATPNAFVGKKLRTLEGLEEYFWLSENKLPHTTLTIAEVEGPTTVSAWKNALDKVQQRYPLFAVRIRKNPGERPYFETLPGVELPFRVVPFAGADIDKLAAQERAQSFGHGDGLLARVTLCYSPQRCIIFFMAHHAITDGLTNVQIIQELVAAAAGETLGKPFPVLPALGEYFSLSEPGLYVEPAPVENASGAEHALPAIKMQREFFPAEEMKALRERARVERTTVHGALLAAFLLAGRHGSERWRTAPVVCLSPMNLRPMLDLANAPGCLVGIHPSVMQPSDDFSFWEFARKLKEEMHASQSKEAAKAGVQFVRDVVEQEGDPDDVSTINPKGLLLHDLMVSNYGDPGVRTDFGPLQLKTIYPSVHSGEVETQTVSVVTVGGTLYITNVSRHPFPTLTKDACNILRDACAAVSPEA